MNKFLAVGFFFCLFIPLTYGAGPTCQYDISVDNVNFNWNGQSLTYTANISLNRTPRSRQCANVKVGFSKGLAGNYFRKMFSGSESVEYNLYKNNQVNVPLEDLNDASSSDESVFIDFLPGQGTASTTFEVRLPVPNLGRTVVPVGNYSDVINVYAQSTSNPTTISNSSFQVKMDILGEIDISLVSTGSPYDPNATLYTMDFNTLQTGDEKNMDLIVKANSGYQISLTSQHGGSLKHLSKSYNVPYQLKINGAGRSFTGPGSSIDISGTTPNTSNKQRRYSIGIQIGNTQNKLAGQYQDVITITASSTN